MNKQWIKYVNEILEWLASYRVFNPEDGCSYRICEICGQEQGEAHLHKEDCIIAKMVASLDQDSEFDPMKIEDAIETIAQCLAAIGGHGISIGPEGSGDVVRTCQTWIEFHSPEDLQDKVRALPRFNRNTPE